MDPSPDALPETSPRTSGPGPYPPSWVDRLNDAVRGSPFPAVVVYLVLGVAATLIGQAALWYYGIAPLGSFRKVSLSIGIWTSLPLASVQYLDGLAAKGLAAFRPALALSDEEFQELRYRLTTMPALPVVLMNLFILGEAIVGNVLYPGILELVVGEGQPTHPILLVSASALGVSGSLIYHTIRQLGIVRSLYSDSPRLSIFDPSSTYAFSTLTLSTALAWMLILYLGVLTVPGILAHPAWVSVSAAIMLLIFGSIGSVLLRINAKLTDEKNRLQTEVTGRLVEAMSRVHQKYDSDDLADMEKLRHLVLTLIDERELLRKTPTWPWQPGTLLTFVSAIALPIVVFLIQELLRRLADLS